MKTLWLPLTSGLPTAHVQYLGANVATDRQEEEEEEGRRGDGWGGVASTEGEMASTGGGPPCPCGTDAVTWEHIRVYMQGCVRLCMQGSGLVGYQGNGCVGLIRESPAGGEASEALPWQPPGQGGVCICAALAPAWIVAAEAV